jgi:uncharacterized membrane protein YqjE
MSEVRSDEPLEDKSLGELVAIATGSVSHLVKSEIELAKMELRDDAKKAAFGSVLFGLAGLTGGIFLILMSVAAALGLITAGVWNWLAFIIVAVAWVVLGGVLALVGKTLMKRMTGVSRTRRTMKGDFALFRRNTDADDKPALTG